jgi:hypothetical protein
MLGVQANGVVVSAVCASASVVVVGELLLFGRESYFCGNLVHTINIGSAQRSAERDQQRIQSVVTRSTSFPHASAEGTADTSASPASPVAQVCRHDYRYGD